MQCRGLESSPGAIFLLAASSLLRLSYNRFALETLTLWVWSCHFSRKKQYNWLLFAGYPSLSVSVRNTCCVFILVFLRTLRFLTKVCRKTKQNKETTLPNKQDNSPQTEDVYRDYIFHAMRLLKVLYSCKVTYNHGYSLLIKWLIA